MRKTSTRCRTRLSGRRARSSTLNAAFALQRAPPYRVLTVEKTAGSAGTALEPQAEHGRTDVLFVSLIKAAVITDAHLNMF